MQTDPVNNKPSSTERTKKVFYKYRMASERTEDIITKKSIWLAKPETLNDPLECQIKPISAQELRKHVREVKTSQASGFMMSVFMAQKNGTRIFGMTERKLKRLLKTIKAADSFNKKYQIICDFYESIGATGFSSPEGYFQSLKKLLDEVGIFSLTEDPANTLMWSHYGDSHRGIAFGFEAVEGSDLADGEKCQRVNYSDTLSEFSFERGFSASMAFYATGKPIPSISFNDNQVQRAFFSKTNDWAYEREWRYIQKTAGAYTLPAPITEVIFGAKCSDEVRKKYHAIIAKNIGKEVRFREACFLPGTTSLDLKDC